MGGELRQSLGFGVVAAVLVAGGVFLLDGVLAAAAVGLFWMALSQVLPAVAYVVQRLDGRGGRLFLKGADGVIPGWWLVGYLPFVLSRYVNVVVVRVVTREPAATDLGGGIVVGGRIMPWDRAGVREMGVSAVLDVCAEIPRDFGMKGDLGMPGDGGRYLAVPVLDASGPTVEQLGEGVSWALERLAEGDVVLVQCTLGHGRSATFVAGMLLATGVAETVDDAVGQMRARRGHVGLNRAQRGSLERGIEGGVIGVGSSPSGERA